MQLHQADKRIANVDGADWIRNQIRHQSLPLEAIGLVFCHLAENVHETRRIVFGEEGEKGREAPSPLETARNSGQTSSLEPKISCKRE